VMSDVDGTLAETHVVPVLGNKKLADLRAHDIDRLLAAKRDSLSTATLARVLAVLRRSIRWAEARDLVGRNVAALCSAPTGTDGRPSKSLTLDQARNVMLAAESSPLAAYVVLALLTGLRTEELRALTWDHLDLAGDAQSVPPRPPSVQVWRSVRAGGAPRRGARGEPSRCRTGASRRSTDSGTRSSGRACGLRRDSSSPPTTGRSSMRRTCGAPFDTSATERGSTLRRGRRESCGTRSCPCCPTPEYQSRRSRLVGHSSTTVTETVYRKQLRPVLTGGAQVMDTLFDLPVPADAER
jgi:integrase